MTPMCINFSSFLDESICSIPDLEELPNPDLTEIPSFLGQNYQTGDYGRVLDGGSIGRIIPGLRSVKVNDGLLKANACLQ